LGNWVEGVGMRFQGGVGRLGVLVLAGAVGTAVYDAKAHADDVVPSTTVSSFVNVREGRSTSTPIVGRLPPGSRATLLDDTTASWYRVELPSHIVGWVSKRWTEIVRAPTPTPPPPIAVRRVASPRDVPRGRHLQGHSGFISSMSTGLSILIQGSDFDMLYDGGSKDDKRGMTASGNKNRLLAYLAAAIGPSGPAGCVSEGDGQAQGSAPERVLGTVVLSHPHEDHGNLLDDALTCYRVLDIWDTGVVNDAAFYPDFLRAVVNEDGATFHTAAPLPAARTFVVQRAEVRVPESCAGGALFSGIESSWLLRDVYAYSEPFRLDHSGFRPAMSPSSWRCRGSRISPIAGRKRISRGGPRSVPMPWFLKTADRGFGGRAESSALLTAWRTWSRSGTAWVSSSSEVRDTSRRSATKVPLDEAKPKGRRQR